MATAKTPRFRVPTYSINYIVGTLYVTTPDDEVRADIARAIAKSKTPFTPAQVRKCQDYAVKVHKKNQDLFKHFRF